MTLEAIYFVSQVVAAVAIVASLIFVGLQLRHSNKALQAAAHDERARLFRSMWDEAKDPEIAALLVKIGDGVSQFTDIEAEQASSLAMSHIAGLQDQWIVHRDGRLSEDRWETTLRLIEAYMTIPAARAAYRTMEAVGWIEPAFRETVSPYLEAGRKSEPLALRTIWCAFLTENLAAHGKDAEVV